MTETNAPEPKAHIHFEKEPNIEVARRRSPPNPSAAPRDHQRVRQEHGAQLRTSTTQTVGNLKKQRLCLGIDPDTLVVVEVNSWDAKVRDTFETRFGAAVVDESVSMVEKEQKTRVLVQFPDSSTLKSFEQELEKYADEKTEKGLLTQKQRDDFFDQVEGLRQPEPEEKQGPRLRKEGWPQEDVFVFDVDLWHPGERDLVFQVLDDLKTICKANKGTVVDDFRTSTLLLTRIRGNTDLGNELLRFDRVAKIDLPPKLPSVYTKIFDPIQPLDQNVEPTGNEPRISVIDSGIQSGHPLLRGWVADAHDFNSGDGTPVDLDGHGTQVAGLAVYGSVARCIETNQWQPQALIYSGKVLTKDSWGNLVFPEDRRPEAVVAEAIQYFHREHSCRIFNLSLGNDADVYRGGRQFPWAESLDKLARTLDIVIVVPSGNWREPPIPNSHTRDSVFQATRDQSLEQEEARICNPATASIALTVGAITRSENPRTRDCIAAAPESAPAPFSRVGPGYEIKSTQRAVKPEFVAYGGNYAIRTMPGTDPMWLKNDLQLGEPTLRLETNDGRYVCVATGTSFASPQIANMAALAQHSLRQSLGTEPSANAIRALLGTATRMPRCGSEWLKDPENKEIFDRLRLVGYGLCSQDLIESSQENNACLIAEDQLPLDRWHVYSLPVPQDFLRVKGTRGIVVALAFDPPVRANRKEYLSRTMWIEAIKGLSIEEIKDFRGPRQRGGTESLPKSKILEMRPTKTNVQWSTLQVRRKMWTRAVQFPTNGNEPPVLHVVVGCHQRFDDGDDENQRYAVSVRFWHEDQNIRLYQSLQNTVRVRVSERVRIQQTHR